MQRMMALAMCVLAAPVVLLAQDYTKYDTVNNPKRYGTIWAPFYQKANELTAQTRKDFPSHLDISFGASPKQALDVYLETLSTDEIPTSEYRQLTNVLITPGRAGPSAQLLPQMGTVIVDEFARFFTGFLSILFARLVSLFNANAQQEKNS